MKLKKKIQNKIYSKQKIEDQIWYNQQITRYFEFFATFIKCFPHKKKPLSSKPI
jgi:hypothetical protein